MKLTYYVVLVRPCATRIDLLKGCVFIHNTHTKIHNIHKIVISLSAWHRSKMQVPGMGSLERRILEVNRKRVKVVKPGSKTSFPTTEIRGTYTPPFHVSSSSSSNYASSHHILSCNAISTISPQLYIWCGILGGAIQKRPASSKNCGRQ